MEVGTQWVTCKVSAKGFNVNLARDPLCSYFHEFQKKNEIDILYLL